MKLLRHGVISLVIFATLVTLCMGIYNAFQEDYDLTESNLHDDKNIMESLNDLNIVAGMNRTVSGFQALNTPKSNPTDVLGALAAGGLGFLQIVVSFITTPFEIFTTIALFYGFPPVLVVLINIIVIISAIFIIVSAYLRGDI